VAVLWILFSFRVRLQDKMATASTSSPRWSLSSDIRSPPPSYRTGASRPPSFRSSVHGSDSDSISPASEPPNVLKKPSPRGEKWPLKSILEDEKPATPPPPYTSPKRKRRPFCLWICPFVLLILIIAVVPPVVVRITK
jgi:hypothetical protein